VLREKKKNQGKESEERKRVKISPILQNGLSARYRLYVNSPARIVVIDKHQRSCEKKASGLFVINKQLDHLAH